MVSMLFRDPQAFSSILAAFGTLQPQAIGSLNHIETLDSASNYYLSYAYSIHAYVYILTQNNCLTYLLKRP